MLDQRLQRVYEQLREIIEQGEGESVNDLLKGRLRDDFLTIFTCANIRKKCQDGVEYDITPLGYTLDSNNWKEKAGVLLGAAKEEGILKKVLTSMVESDYERLKRSLWVTGNHDSLNEIYKIEKSMAIDIAMKVGGALSVITALAVGGGCFAAGVQLPILALVGIAVAAALAVGIVAGGITYAVLKPSNKLDKPDSNKVASVAHNAL